MESCDRLFVPLTAEVYEWYRSGLKRWEIRRYGRQYTEKTVRLGRRVELRYGYSDRRRSLWGTIVRVDAAPTMDQFFEKAPYPLVIPTAGSLQEAICTAQRILNVSPDRGGPFLGFEVELER